MITQKGLSPNQYYVMCSMRDSVSPIVTNLHLELRLLKASGWVTEDEIPKLTPEAVALINQIEKLFSSRKKATSTSLMGKDYKDKLKRYNEIFPNVKLPSGSAARSALSNVETRMRWFFDNHDYTWDEIYAATAAYIDDKQKNNLKYCRNSQYFIKKSEKDGTVNSDLANFCEIIRTGGDVESTPTFSTNVV